MSIPACFRAPSPPGFGSIFRRTPTELAPRAYPRPARPCGPSARREPIRCDGFGAIQYLRHRGDEIAAHGAAEAPVVQQRHGLLGARGDAGGVADELVVDADGAHLVLDDGDLPAVALAKDVIQQRRLARAEEARQHRHRHLPRLRRSLLLLRRRGDLLSGQRQGAQSLLVLLRVDIHRAREVRQRPCGLRQRQEHAATLGEDLRELEDLLRLHPPLGRRKALGVCQSLQRHAHLRRILVVRGRVDAQGVQVQTLCEASHGVHDRLHRLHVLAESGHRPYAGALRGPRVLVRRWWRSCRCPGHAACGPCHAPAE